MNDNDISFLVDDAIPYADALFCGLGDVRFFDRRIGGIPDDGLARADVLAVTSSTRVDADLLSRCNRLRIVATPVVGTDHIDFDAITAAGERLGHEIAVANAPGSTAQAVADWTVAAMMYALGRMPGKVAIVGMGNCGRAVAKRLALLRIPYVACDPIRAAAEPGFAHVPIGALDHVDVATFHVPLTRPGQSPFPTAGIISREFVTKFRARGGLLIVNSSRGGIMDEAGMFGGDATVLPMFALDVFNGEPSPAPETVAAAAVATPHVAGSGRLGRLKAAEMVRADVCRILGLAGPALTIAPSMVPVRPTIEIDVDALGTAAGFVAFRERLADLSGVALSDEFRAAWAASEPAGRPTLFAWTRAVGLRAEPIWEPA